jgi:hypothetical protein
VLSGRGLCEGLITRPEESYQLWCVLVCYLGTSRMRRLKLAKGCKCRIKEEEEEHISAINDKNVGIKDNILKTTLSKRFNCCCRFVS